MARRQAVIPDFTCADLEPGYTSVTPLLHLGPATPFDAVYTVDSHEAVVLLLEARHVAVPGSAEARFILARLALTESEIDMKLRVARYGVSRCSIPEGAAIMSMRASASRGRRSERAWIRCSAEGAPMDAYDLASWGSGRRQARSRFCSPTSRGSPRIQNRSSPGRTG